MDVVKSYSSTLDMMVRVPMVPTARSIHRHRRRCCCWWRHLASTHDPMTQRCTHCSGLHEHDRRKMTYHQDQVLFADPNKFGRIVV